MADIGTKLVDSADSAVMKAITRYVLTPAIIVLCAISTVYLRGLAEKVDGAAARADVEKTALVLKAEGDASKAELWKAIGSTTKAQNELITNMAVLKVQMDTQNRSFMTESSFLRTTLSDIQQRLNGVKRN